MQPDHPETSRSDREAAGPKPDARRRGYVFPVWANYLVPVLVLGAIGAGTYLPVFLGFGLSPDTINLRYAPEQPVPFSHALHAGELGMDCRYCHNTVERAGHAAIPPTMTCMNCHSNIQTESPQLAPVFESYAEGTPIPWVKVHDLADYAYFNHAVHVSKGVSCVSCHGRVDKMEVVYQAEPLSMAWCLECHREPEKHLRPREEVTNMDWSPAPPGSSPQQVADAQLKLGLELKEQYNIHDRAYMTSCSVCHR